MANLEGLKVNQIVEISVKTGKHTDNYPSRVEDIQKDIIILAAPIKKSFVVPLTINTEIQVNYFYQNAVYSFDTYILSRESSPLPLLEVIKPSEVKRIQRRNFVRFDVKLPLKVGLLAENLNNPLAEICAKTIDISGGGLSFISKDKFEKDGEITLEIELPDMGLVNAVGKVVRVGKKENNNNEFIYSVGFIFIDEFDRDKIVKYIFNKQREFRAKGLL